MVFCCSICQERLDWASPDNAALRACAVKCGHTFHFGCIKQWWIRLYEAAGQHTIEATSFPVRCPICRHTNTPQLFELKFLFKDDDLFCSENEMNESIILHQNIEEVMEECKQIKVNLENKNIDICNEKETKSNLEIQLYKVMKEKNDFQALILTKEQSKYMKQSLCEQASSSVSKDKVQVLSPQDSNKENDQIHTKKMKNDDKKKTSEVARPERRVLRSNNNKVVRKNYKLK